MSSLSSTDVEGVPGSVIVLWSSSNFGSHAGSDL